MGRRKASAKTEIISRVKRSENQLLDELLEGIPNDITLVGIAAKLPWRAWQLAASLSPDWQRAFKGGIVYDARVYGQMRETFVIALCDFSKYYAPLYTPIRKATLSLFSPNEECWYTLPAVPGYPTRMPINSSAKLACLDSSIYVLGGLRNDEYENYLSAEVLVLHLAVRPLEWRRCADMQIQRAGFKVGVMHGKIFVFGGYYKRQGPMCNHLFSECSNEVYDPKLDAWSWIAPLKPSRFPHSSFSVSRVWSVGQEFLCRAGCTTRNAAPDPAEWRPWMSDIIYASYDSGRRLARGPSYDSGISLFARDGARGPYFVHAPHHKRSDQMDGIHKIIEDQFIDKVGRLPLPLPRTTIHAEDLANDLQAYKERSRLESIPYVWTYNPLKDDWREFEWASLGTNTIEEWDNFVKTKRSLHIPSDPYLEMYTRVWTMSL